MANLGKYIIIWQISGKYKKNVYNHMTNSGKYITITTYIFFFLVKIKKHFRDKLNKCLFAVY